jgi:hypothetical protein
MHENAKTQLLELLKNLGCSEDCADFQSQSMSPSGPHQSTVIVSFPDGRTVQRTGEECRHKTDADISAAQATIEQLCNEYPDLVVNWAEINVEAQAGDALIKLGIYLAADIKSASDKSHQLQSLESDSHLAKVFDQWKTQGDSDLAMWGANLGEKRKATLVEALLWRRFGMQVITADASEPLQTLINTLATK